MLSRIEKFKDLREKINKEIELAQRADDSNKDLGIIKSSLLSIDKSYFQDIINSLEKEYDWVSTNYDKNVYKEPYDQDLTYAIRESLNKMNKDFNFAEINQNNFDTIKKNETIDYESARIIMKKILLKEDKSNDSVFQKYDSLLEKIKSNEKLYNDKLKSAKSIEEDEIEEDINMEAVQEIRSEDNRSIESVIKSVNINNLKRIKLLTKNSRKIKKNGKWMFVFILVSCFLSSLSIILAVIF